jgi:hypothetical protein
MYFHISITYVKSARIFIICIISKCRLVSWLVGDHLLLRDFGPYGIIFMIIITVIMVMLLRDFEPYGVIFMTLCLLL